MMRRATVGVLKPFGPGALRMVLLGAVATGAFLLLAACGGGEEEGEEKEASPAVPAATETPSEATATVTPTEEAREATATVTPAETQTAAGEIFYGLDSFHYRLEMQAALSGEEEPLGFGITSEGDYVAPDRHAWSITTDIGSLSLEEEAIVIGESAWYRSGGDWRETTVDDPDIQDAVDFSTMDPDFFPDLEDFEGLRGEDGLKVRHYQVSEEAVDFLKSFMDVEDLEGIEQFSMEFWVASDGGWPVRMIFQGRATAEAMELEGLGSPEGSLVDFSLRFDVTQVNDPSVTIEPPI
jgi:hypothetical protein